MNPKLILFVLIALLFPTLAQAYIGPGTGAGTIAAVFGILASVVLGIFAVVYYPLKRALRKRKVAAEQSQTGDTPASNADEQ